MQYCMWLWLAPIHPHPPPSTATATAIHPHPPPPPPPPWCDRRTDTSRQPDSFFRLLWRREKKQQTNKHEIKKKSHHRKRIVSSVTTWVKHIACLFFFVFLFNLYFGGRAGFGALRSAALTLMRMDVFEMRILYEDVIHDILFYFLFFPPPFSFRLHLCC